MRRVIQAGWGEIVSLSSLVRDEQGRYSTARCALWATLIVTLILVTLSAFRIAALSSAAYSLLGTLVIAFSSWAGGPRVAQYLAPQISKVSEALAKAKGDERWPDARRDDERGEE